MSDAEQARDLLQARGAAEGVEIAVVTGAGLGNVADGLDGPVIVPYAELPGFPKRAAPANEDRVVIGSHDGVRVGYLQGRTHFYENADSRGMAVPLETMALLGARTIIVTSAAGSVRADLYPGTLVSVTDHINFNGFNPLIGGGAESAGLGLMDAYDPRLLKRLKRASVGGGVTLHEGVLMWFSGPSFETPSEIKMARTLGADLTAMAVVPEIILARDLGLRCAAICIVTHFGAGFSGGNPNSAQAGGVALQGAIGLRRLIRSFLKTKEEGLSL